MTARRLHTGMLMLDVATPYLDPTPHVPVRVRTPYGEFIATSGRWTPDRSAYIIEADFERSPAEAIAKIARISEEMGLYDD
jgi:hypothetical protein